jgi:hypothetical protein
MRIQPRNDLTTNLPGFRAERVRLVQPKNVVKLKRAKDFNGFLTGISCRWGCEEMPYSPPDTSVCARVERAFETGCDSRLIPIGVYQFE